MPLIDDSALAEQDILRIPTAAGYVDYPLANLINVTGGPLRSTSNFGLPPIRFITTRGPFQNGETPLDIRLDPRVIQIEIVDYLCNRTEYWTRRNELLDLIRPNRAFSSTGTYRPLVYRKFLPGGKFERASGMTCTNDGAAPSTCYAYYGRFVHYGGLQAGDVITIAGTDYVIQSVPNDYNVIVDGVVAGTGLAWAYRRNRARRNIDVLLEQGPTFNEQVGSYRYPEGYREALRFVAHNPVWRGPQQEDSWAIADALGDLIFDGEGAWFSATPGSGRWIFAGDYVGEMTNIVYWGTWPARPKLILTGPATFAVFENMSLGLRLELDYSVAAGEVVTIDTEALTCTNNAGVNLLPYLSGDLATFVLDGEPQVPNRLNAMAVTFNGATTASNARILWQNQYIGI